MFDDFYIANWWYAELLGISKAQFNFLERIFVQLLRYDLSVSVDDYKAYCAHMRDFIKEVIVKPQEIPQQAQVQYQKKAPVDETYPQAQV